MRVLLAQLAPVEGDPAANAARLESALAAHDAQLAVFPELFLCGTSPAAWRAGALAPGAAPLRAVAAAAARTGTAVIAGYAERAGAVVHNAALCVDADGTVAGVYRKTHLFGDAERAAFAPGDALLVAGLAGVRTAPLICFDVEFPEPARTVAYAGARLLVTIAANFDPYGPDHELATRARALDNRLPHVYVNCPGAPFTGESRAIAAGGAVLAACGGDEQLLVCELEVAPSTPADVDYLAHARGALRVTGSQLEIVQADGPRFTQ
ncbi:MAG TPA: nitrilase-related carbon-nitrogen hydrolase [Solirubrobacter sp.]|nr:nitrilase-related carbon-nitrogen hydrolase [Solirubrobacter sp.]